MLFACDDKTKSGSDCVGLELKNYKPRHTDMRRNLIVGMFRSRSFSSKIFLKKKSNSNPREQHVSLSRVDLN